MNDFSYDYSVLVIAEPDFLNKGKDCEAYREKLMNFLEKRAGESTLRAISITGSYGLPMETQIEVDSRNKTSFVKSLDDQLLQFNEIVIITNFENDSYIDALSIRAAELSKTLTIYGYETK
ncbi:hypothetical protein N1M2_212 [Klebsiella phage N1M2]|uniref:Uncharacterized protein n=1 Tax=Klebsiella phage N1M2 TaxID=2664939 RepID=A0A6B7ZF73_9CAUD|nr:hypothetical protein PQB72_gp212 [Klebsiella phage N1M2]QGH72075.1 hypothetical protein N1M2_212 [Klebsiella phage N1M2]